ncbi:DUF4403 family protein [Flavobacterium urocaniciphilum]|uniref:DUF4403 family protein n=1 Tax=Flavobacterium urocaniciphilum TaxID=1299341 RepID=A0A1H9DLC5_9FLAO|nr:DUF4403 family protein [Flavobacterium urocaniciphilum]SEQ14219.1 protein of unknown function [Flavobacterium urocaniciphilum]
MPDYTKRNSTHHMNSKIKILLFGILNISLFSCSTTKKIEALKPEPSTGAEIVYSNKTSLISMPMEVSVKEIEHQVNKNLKGLIYNDSILNDDKTEMKIWKTNDIKLVEKNGEIISVIPLKIWAKFKYGTEFLGLNDTREINLNGTITLNSKANFANWKLNTTSKIEDFEWSESPSILVAGKNVPITYIINPTLSIFKGKVAKMIDEAINKSCDFKEQVYGVLETMSTPFLASETYETWFKMVPTELYSTNAVLKNAKVTMNLGLKCQMQTMVGQKPKTGFDKSKLISKAVGIIPSDFNASIAAVSSYESASRIMTKNFMGQEFGSGKRKITVQKVDIWHKEGKMIIALDMLGSVNGTIYLAGVPKYNSETKEIYFDDLDYVLNTKGILTRTANWLLQGVILNKIKENCKYSIKPNLDEGKKNMLPYLTNYSPMKGVFVNGKLNDFVFEKIEMNNDGIVAFITSSGNMKITIDGMD